MTIIEFLLEHRKTNPVSFHMPGHKGHNHIKEYGYGEFLDNILGCDITEIDGADNLFQPEGIIKNTMEAYENLYKVKATRLLVNGSSCGLLASILAIVKPGEKIIMARNCHKSIFNGVSLGGIVPIYVKPNYIDEYGISGDVSVDLIKECVEKNKDAKAIILPSPNYYGICSNIEGISNIAHENDMILIVDQAHGAHLKFYDEKMAAENLGADIVINSTHKTLFSFTESAILNVCSDEVDLMELDDKIQAIETSSPSYLLMASLDINSQMLKEHGDEFINKWKGNIEFFWKESENIKGLKIMNHKLLDNTKLNLDMSKSGLSGGDLEKELIKRNIYPELVSGNIVMCMSGIGNIKEDYIKLLDALKDISINRETVEGCNVEKINEFDLELKEVPKEKVRIKLLEALGKIAAESITPYPPGIPIVCPGEVINSDVIDYVTKLRKEGYKVTGVDVNGKVAVGK